MCWKSRAAFTSSQTCQIGEGDAIMMGEVLDMLSNLSAGDNLYLEKDKG